MGGPYVFRMNLNQQSSGHTWETHKQLMQTTSPIVDCGIHYLDVMCQITDANPVEVRGMGVRLTDEIDPQMYNYGHLQVLFDDGSVGWYEAGWGPMMSETAFFVKDVISPNGCVSIVMDESAKSDDIDTHTKTSVIRLHSAATGADGKFVKSDEHAFHARASPTTKASATANRPSCSRQSARIVDLDRHMDDTVKSLTFASLPTKACAPARRCGYEQDLGNGATSHPLCPAGHLPSRALRGEISPCTVTHSSLTSQREVRRRTIDLPPCGGDGRQARGG